ncbi:hypothetical protein HDV00_011615 [Rhizophlyctis rosea]|nr:hypothetical protein HDV00_011615 [Rhizophlyctis rosea]
MPPKAEKKPPNPKAAFVHKTLITVFLALLIDILAFTIILPLYPRILAHYENVDGNDETSLYYAVRTVVQRFRETLGIKGTGLDIVLFGGALGSMFSFLQFVSSPVIGRLSDKYGRRTVLLVSMALVGIAFSLGFTVGPPLGAYFTSYHLHALFPTLKWLPINEYSSPALFAFILILIETAYLFVALPETLNFKSSPLYRSSIPATETKPQPTVKATPATPSAGKAQQTASLPLLSTIHFLFLFLFSGMEFTLTFLTHDRFAFSHAQQGRLLGFMGILAALVQGGYVRRYAHKGVSERDMVVQGIASAGAGLSTLAWGDRTSLRSLYIAAAFLAFTSGTVVTSLTALASGVGKVESGGGGGGGQGVGGEGGGGEEEQGHVLGKFRSAGQLGRCLGPIFACGAYWVMGAEVAYGGGGVAMVVLAVLVVVVVPRGGGRVGEGKKRV